MNEAITIAAYAVTAWCVHSILSYWYREVKWAIQDYRWDKEAKIAEVKFEKDHPAVEVKTNA